MIQRPGPGASARLTGRRLARWTAPAVLALTAATATADLELLAIFADRILVAHGGERVELTRAAPERHGLRLIAIDARGGMATIETQGRRRTLSLRERVIANGCDTRVARFPRAHDGHWNARGSVNGQTTVFQFDPEAPALLLSEREANRLGLPPRHGDPVRIPLPTGTLWGRRILLNEVRVGQIARRQVETWIVPGEEPRSGRLGQSFLQGLAWRVQGDVLTLSTCPLPGEPDAARSP